DEATGQCRFRFPPAERALSTRAGHRDGRKSVGRALREYADNGVTGCRVQELDVGGSPENGESRSRDDFSWFEPCATTNEKLRGGDVSRGRAHGGAKRETGGGIVAGRLIRCQCATQSSPVPNSGIADVVH